VAHNVFKYKGVEFPLEFKNMPVGIIRMCRSVPIGLCKDVGLCKDEHGLINWKKCFRCAYAHESGGFIINDPDTKEIRQIIFDLLQQKKEEKDE